MKRVIMFVCGLSFKRNACMCSLKKEFIFGNENEMDFDRIRWRLSVWVIRLFISMNETK